MFVTLFSHGTEYILRCIFQAKFLPYNGNTKLVTCRQDHQIQISTLDACAFKNSTMILNSGGLKIIKIFNHPLSACGLPKMRTCTSSERTGSRQ